MQTDGFHSRPGESGNVLFFILLGVVLIGLVTAAIRSGGGEGANIDREQAIIAASQVREFAALAEGGVIQILQNGISESDIRFAHPDAPSDYGSISSTPARQLFDRSGGGVEYRKPPAGANDGSRWEFYGKSSLPQVGSASRGDLIAVLPAVAAGVCERLNAMNGLDPATQPEDPGTCLNAGSAGRFKDGVLYEDSSPNTADDTTFSIKPALEACVECADGKFYFYHVLIAR